MQTILNILANKAMDYIEDSFLKERWKEILKENGEFFITKKSQNHP
jgi:hypothetical protein